ncbi:hypothetical protein HN51_037536 [Arachis hypogaea]|uniref:ZF-HD dimerization-type domain-containing protein n=1 Tax=Arachis hypogaea TaxID=3818 RepID=A0A444ZVG5_ARAHY|nr:zinc-finger homeodomain protein 2-like [Arachis ipaensis]XP_025638732.1 zinc-finger homeodomain protein 2-like [Arachis hypogaea]QHO03092.1 Zinc-finger homeodomain protein [Arachis hypogaea]RYR18213.1 hypothetical protein Ahy_B03g062837 isoform E [Arachis hypogaea]
MEFEEDFTIPPPPSYADSVPNPSRVKMPTNPPPPPAMPRNTGKGRYMECLKNHALALGGHALDGCGEFMPAGADGTLDALNCAACNCHRNFHRKETVAGDAFLLPHHHYNPFHNHRHHQAFPQFAACYRAQGAGYLHVSGHQRGGSTPTLALPSISGGGGGTTQSTRDDHEDGSEPSGGGGVGSASKKRFRTKFSPEQKEKMTVFAESVGWKLQKHDEVAVQGFCDEVGVKRNVLKVWMHNHKNTLAIKKP